MSSARSQGRRLALKILFAHDMSENNPGSWDHLIQMAAPKAPQIVKDFARQIVEGLLHVKPLLDQTIESTLKDWKIDRLHPIELNILRIGIYELTYCPDIPAMVAVNESVDLAHRFGDETAWRLVNGILDQVGKVRLEAEAKPPPPQGEDDRKSGKQPESFQQEKG